ncbi:MAG: SDR family NAD(P)-dependent oxidoreductase [Steroidobacteraceae bacterium]
MPITLITGASSGFGAALTRVFAANGHHVVMVARRAEELTAFADSIAAVGHPRPHVLPLDLATPDAGDRLEHRLAEHGCEPAFVVSSAAFGLLGPAALLDRRAQTASTQVGHVRPKIPASVLIFSRIRLAPLGRLRRPARRYCQRLHSAAIQESQ